MGLNTAPMVPAPARAVLSGRFRFVSFYVSPAAQHRPHIMLGMHRRRLCLAALLGCALPFPAALTRAGTAEVTDEVWLDPERQRQIPVRVRWPDGAAHPGARPVLLFSHGLGGSVDGGTVWGEAWAAAGFVVLHLQHPGSDLAALRTVASSFRDQRALRAAASPAQLLARLRDVGFVLDEIGRRHAAAHWSTFVQAGCGASLLGTARRCADGRWATVRPTQVGLSGHSFGAHTTLGMAGQRYPGFEGITEPRLASFIAFSPTAPMLGDASLAFERITRPLLCITGTRDADVAGVGASPQRRMAVFGFLPSGSKAQLVLQNADHMTFGGQGGRAVEIIDRVQVTRELQARHHALVAAISTDWWRATLQDDAAARDRLAAPPGLAEGDRWEQK